MKDRLVPELDSFDPKSLPDFLLLVAYNVEESLLQCGAEPGRDYRLLDVFNLAMPFASDVFKQGNITLITPPQG